MDEGLKGNIAKLSDDELVQMVTADVDEYVPEAIDFARQELESRGVPIPDAEDSAGETHLDEEEEGASAGAPGATCFVCNGPMRRGALVGESELIVVFRDNDEQRFIEVVACARCGETRLVVDYESDVKE